MSKPHKKQVKSQKIYYCNNNAQAKFGILQKTSTTMNTVMEQQFSRVILASHSFASSTSVAWKLSL